MRTLTKRCCIFARATSLTDYREGKQDNQMETMEKLFCELFDLLPPLTSDVELMAQIWIGLITGVQPDGFTHYQKGGGLIVLSFVAVSTTAAFIK